MQSGLAVLICDRTTFLGNASKAVQPLATKVSYFVWPAVNSALSYTLSVVLAFESMDAPTIDQARIEAVGIVALGLQLRQ